MPSPSGRPRRPLWHWLLLGGAGALGLLVVGIFAVVIAFQVLTRGNPRTTLEDFYSSLENTDCELFMESTTDDFRRVTGLTSCESFEETLGDVSAIDYRVQDRINRQGYAIFEVTETYSDNGEAVEVELRYYVRRIDGQWDLDVIELVAEGGEPIT
ncbi:hypothetical protein CFK39_03525 [Brachybacterium avium]|uniref:DUF4878 domain-containing protein n=1 Tax=Brachybacterium avium TaxID=2017485 RepID=A0A220UAV2_9MICO|nr:hypothetical protein [Brachybacterium avium]ASK65046.1 hypothetical protein CFK39_03525 [Brachybacterium avium]